MVRTKEELQRIAGDALTGMPKDMRPSELAYVISEMLKGHAITLKSHGN